MPRYAAVEVQPAQANASRYRCKRLALVYPASRWYAPGKITEFVLMTEERPILEVVTVDVRELASGSGIPRGLETLFPTDSYRSRERSL